MKKVMLIMMAIAICMGAVAARGNETVAKRVPVTQFDKVSFTAGVTVKFTQGSTHECTIIASPKDMEKIKVEVKNKRLDVSVEGKKKKMNGVTFSSANLSDDVIVKVTSPELNSVDCLGSGDFIATTDIKTNDIIFKITGSGDIKLKKVSADKMKLSISGSGDIDLQQTNARILDVSIAGSGDIEINKVDDKCESASLSVAGSGDIDAMFSGCQELKCNVAGSGEIELKGKVVNYSSSIAGSGEIKKNELVITGDCNEKGTNYRPKNHKKPRTVNNINAEP
ncbi:MAG: head GIN domain-containing protein [Prevotella sp.]